MKSLTELADIMRKDWNRRVRHDYRFWVSNEISSGSIMWDEGARDFERVHRGITANATGTALEIGCGVGRMLRAAAQSYRSVIGVDVSSLAIEKARELLSDDAHIELHANSGFDLTGIADNSVDFAWSFAALSHMPTRVTANYLAELRRVLRPSGVARLQVFFGGQSGLSETDSLRLRAYSRKAISEALALAGFSMTDAFDVTLPLGEILEEIGLEPKIITITPTGAAAYSAERIAAALLPEGENALENARSATEFEAWLALNYADRLYQDGDFERARTTLQYVAQHCQSASIDIRDTLEKLSVVAATNEVRDSLSDTTSPGSVYEANLAVVQERFPEVYAAIKAASHDEASTLEVRASVDGPVLWTGETCLDHPEKPKAAAEAWVKRTMNDGRFARCGHVVVVGFGAGYHLETLLARGSHKVSCVEPSVRSLKKALGMRDMRDLLSRIECLALTPESSSIDHSEGAELMIRPQLLALDNAFVERVTSVFYARRGLSVLHPKIAVLGPLQGGTLPIGQYTTSALTRLKQRVRGVDMSGFNSAYELIGGLITCDIRRNLARQGYIETLSSVLLESLNEKPIDILICMAQAPISPRVLQELRRQGVITVLWFVEDYLRFTYWKDMAKYYDYVFTIQKGDCIDAIRKAGAGQVHYLPTGCDPYFHTPLRLTDTDRERWGSPLSFVGAGYHNRQQAFASLAHYPLKIWGSEWPLCKPFDKLVQEDSRRIAPEEYIKIFNATDININLHSSSERDGVDPTGDFLNPRTFELAACGAFQLVDERSLLGEAFRAGEEIVTFSSIADLKEKIDYYLERPEERRTIAERGRQRALRDHSYERRLEEMLSIIYSQSYQRLRSREQTSPWSEMLRRAEVDPELRERCQRSFERGEEPNLDGLVADITTGRGNLTETEQKLLFLFHVRKQIIRMEAEGAGVKN